jgi:hypothetical protein
VHLLNEVLYMSYGLSVSISMKYLYICFVCS